MRWSRPEPTWRSTCATTRDGTLTTQVFGTDEEIAALADAGYSIGATIQDYNDYLARMAERQAAIDASNAAAEGG